MNEQMKRIMKQLFPEEEARKERGQCPFCRKQIDATMEFRDELSQREFRISGLCQKCQDEFFGG